MPGQESWGEGGREGERKASESQAGSGGGVGLRPKEGGVRTKEGRNCQSCAGGGSLVGVGGLGGADHCSPRQKGAAGSSCPPHLRIQLWPKERQ